jgi:hypothetical protein
VVDGFAISVFIGFGKDLTFNISVLSSQWSVLVLSVLVFLFGILFIGLLLFQVYFVIFEIIRPSLAKNYNPESVSLFYFEHIAGLSKDEFQKRTLDLTADQILEHLSGQVYEVAKILTNKTEKLSFAIKLLYSELLVLTAFAILSRFV